jgi:hypothetical protein
VGNRKRALKDISERLQRYVLGIPDGELQWSEVRKIAKKPLPLDHSGNNKSLYTSRQHAAITGSMGSLLVRAVNSPPVEEFLQKAWVIQVGVDVARETYGYKCSRGEIDVETINEVDAIDLAGHEVIDEMANWGTKLVRDLGHEGLINNKAVGARAIIQEVMDKDEMFLLDPIGTDL